MFGHLFFRHAIQTAGVVEVSTTSSIDPILGAIVRDWALNPTKLAQVADYADGGVFKERTGDRNCPPILENCVESCLVIAKKKLAISDAEKVKRLQHST